MISKVVSGILMLMFVFTLRGQVITGRITDDRSNGISNVGVHLLNTQINTFSDKEGNFVINNLTDGKYIIELSAVGYATLTKTITVKEKDNEPFTFQLRNLLQQLENVNVTAEKREEILRSIPVSVTALSSR